MKIDFPNSPVVNSVFVHSAEGTERAWRWDGIKWVSVSSDVSGADFGVDFRGPFPNDNIWISEDGLSQADPLLGAQYCISMGNGALAEGTAVNASVAMGLNAARKFNGRTLTAVGHVCAEFVTLSSSSSFYGGYCGRGFHTDDDTGLDISGSDPLIGNDLCGFGEACMISVRGTAAYNNGKGFNCLFSLSYGQQNTADGFASGMLLTGIRGDGVASSLNSMFGSSSYRYGDGRQNTWVGALSGIGTTRNSSLTGGVAVGDKIIKVLDTTQFGVGDKVFSGSFIKGGTSVTAVTPGGAGLTAPAGTITIDKASWNDFGPDVAATIYAIPNQHRGVGNFGGAYNVLPGIQGTASYNIAWGVSAGGSVSGDDNIFAGRAAGGNALAAYNNIVMGPLMELETPNAVDTLNIGGTLWGKGINHGSPGSIGVAKLPSLITARFHVGGDIRADTNVYANGVLLTSDERVKHDIEPLPEHCLQLVEAIEPKRFRFNPIEDHADDRKHWGFIAQDVERVMGSRALEFGGHEIDAEGKHVLSYNDMIAVLWRAVQELSAKLDARE